jgi:predicted DCC family thiol-disulfide oxidoreductase YuxK
MSDQNSDRKQSSRVIFDGECPMCRSFVAKIGGEEDSSISFDDSHSEATEYPDKVAKDDIEKSLHHIDSSGRIRTGADAVFQTLEDKGSLLLLVRMGRLPVFAQMAEVIYRLVALNRHFLFGPLKTIYWVKVILAIGFLIPLPITKNLWLGETSRFYATTPVIASLPQIAFPFDHFIYYFIVALLWAILLLPNPRSCIIAFLLLVIGYALWDQTRWMPYYFQYVCMFIALLGFDWTRSDGADKALEQQRRVLLTLGVVLVGIWFWSGSHKINYRYIFVGYPWLVHTFTEKLPEPFTSIVLSFGFLSTAIESGGALSLLFKRSRKIGIFLIVGMHSFILLTFGPLGLNFNHSVWSWNIAMIGFCCLIFLSQGDAKFSDFIPGKGLLHRAILVLFCFMPALNFFGVYDDFMSHALYSWTTIEAEIELHDDAVESELPKEIIPSIERQENRSFVHVLRWSYSVFESPPYHAHRVFVSVFGKLCRTIKSKEDISLYVYGKPDWRTGKSLVDIYRCGTGGGPVELSRSGITVKELLDTSRSDTPPSEEPIL